MDKVLLTAREGYYEEKKSKFIANIKVINSEEEAQKYIAQLKKQYWDARHNCYAYILGERNEIQRFSDDGEPGGTAGKPILDVLLSSGLHNIIINVTRYFGGVLLGTGGLVRSYQKASLGALENSTITDRLTGISINLSADYTSIGKIQYINAKLDVIEVNTEYLENVVMNLIVPEAMYNKFIENITEITSGKAQIEKLATVYYGINDDKPVIINEDIHL